MTPIANAYRRPEDPGRPEVFYPLVAYACEGCHLVQLPTLVDPDTLFWEYLYLSSDSRTWLEHCRRYAAETVPRFGLTHSSRVIEVASNDGSLLRYLPGTRIPIHAPERIDETKPEYVLILPWNLTHEITEQMNHVRSWGGRFLVPIPEFKVIE